MFLEKREDDKPHKGSVLLGYDLGEQYAQISYCLMGEGDVETVAPVVGTKQYNIPAILCKRKGTNQWLYGKEAVKSADEEDMIPVEGLLQLARKGEELLLDGEAYDPVALLTLFIRRSLGVMSIIVPVEGIEAIMFCVERMDDRMVEVLLQAAANLNLKTSHIYFQSHTESLYSFMLNQQWELWAYQVVVCEHDGRFLRTYRMECNKKTTPIVTLIEEADYETVVVPAQDEEENIKADAFRLADERFLGILEKMFEGRIVSSAYLLGDGFKEEWHKKSLQFLCRGRRVFQGNNLFSKGAVYSLIERFDPSEAGRTHIFLGADKMKANIGMKALRQGKESYYALLDAGESWYELHKSCEILLSGEREITFVVTPLTGKNAETFVMRLEGAKQTGAPFTRYALEAAMVSADKLHVTVTDMGLGEFFAATEQTWEETFRIL